jgi:hypothetical protein
MKENIEEDHVVLPKPETKDEKLDMEEEAKEDQEGEEEEEGVIDLRLPVYQTFIYFQIRDNQGTHLLTQNVVPTQS